MAHDFIANGFPAEAETFFPTVLFIATWDRVAEFSSELQVRECMLAVKVFVAQDHSKVKTVVKINGRGPAFDFCTCKSSLKITYSRAHVCTPFHRRIYIDQKL